MAGVINWHLSRSFYLLTYLLTYLHNFVVYYVAVIVVDSGALTMSETTATVNINISTLFDDYDYHPRYHHPHHQQPQDDDDANDEPFYEFIKQPVHMVVIYTLAYAAVFLMAVIGNVLVICVVFSNTSMHTVTNYFIVNLAVADLLVGLLCLPITLVANLISGKQTSNNACIIVYEKT